MVLLTITASFIKRDLEGLDVYMADKMETTLQVYFYMADKVETVLCLQGK